MEGQPPPTTSDEVSNKQWIVLHVLQISSASLSVVGSFTIVYKILQELAENRSRFMTPYDRFILGLSACDILASITYAIDQFLVPSEEGDAWAFGTPETCQTTGVLFQVATVWSIWYNCLLSYYFLLRVLSQVGINDLVSKCEIWMHISGLFFPITAIIGYFGGWFDEPKLGSSCWFSDPIKKWIFAGIPTLFTYLSLIINNIVIYVVLRKTLRTSEAAQQQLMREVATLISFYVGCFFITISPTFAKQILETYFGYSHENEGKIYPLLVLQAIFLPLQGFFNVFIYLKPAYTRFRVANPNKPMHFVLRQALFNPKVPRLNFRSDHSNSNAIAEGNAINPNWTLFNSNFRQHSSSSKPSSKSNAKRNNSFEDVTNGKEIKIRHPDISFDKDDEIG